MEEEGRGLKRLRQQSHNADRSSRASSGPPAVALSSCSCQPSRCQRVRSIDLDAP